MVYVPETHSHSVDDEAPNHHEPRPETPIREIFFIFDCGRSGRFHIRLGVPVFLGRFSLNREHREEGDKERKWRTGVREWALK